MFDSIKYIKTKAVGPGGLSVDIVKLCTTQIQPLITHTLIERIFYHIFEFMENSVHIVAA